MFLSDRHLKCFYIDGEWRQAGDQCRLQAVINPANGEVSGHIALAGEAEVDAAIDAAQRAFPAFADSSREQRLVLLENICRIYERRLDDIAAAIALEMGAPLEALSRPLQAPAGLWHFQTAKAVLEGFPFQRRQGGTEVVREPIGVCALITPWNWPMNQLVCKVAPALAVGCSIVLKPSQNSPYSATILAEILDEAGVPKGVFNMINGQGAALGEQLASDPRIDMVSFTGSNGVGAQLSRAAASTIKRVSLELGGKSANLILDDADLEQTVAEGVRSMMSNSGQTCIAPSRMLVPATQLERAEAIAAAVCAELRLGDPFASATEMGPIAHQRQFDSVQRLIASGLEEGARLVCGGLGKPQGLERGLFCKPTVFSAVDNRMTIAREEIFGPVLCLMPYRDLDEAIAIANDSIYGLSGYVQSASVERSRAVALRMRTGSVHLNGASIDLAAPFGGYKQSGNGREWGEAGFEEFLETKAILGCI